MNTWVYDVETFKTFFSAVFINTENAQDVRKFVIHTNSDGRVTRDDSQELLDFISQDNLTLIGHNSIYFDDVVLTALIHYPNAKPENFYNLAGKLINRDFFTAFKTSDIYKEIKYSDRRNWRTIDTMAVTRVNQQRLGLKYAAIILKHNRVQDLPMSPDADVKECDIPLILDYNVNDVEITLKLYREIDNLLTLRRDVGQIFNVDILTANDTEIAKQIYNVKYAERTGQKYSDFKDLRSPVEVIQVKDCIADNIKFVTPKFQKMYDDISKMVVTKAKRFKFEYYFEHEGTKYKFGVGGLHSDDKPRKLVSTEQCRLRDGDLASYHPFCMINNRFLPKHLGKTFWEIFREIVFERIHSKELGKQGDKFHEDKAQGLKIAINSTFGLMGNEHFWLYDPQAMISVTISNQLYLLDLIEKLSLVGVPTVSANTDGIICTIDSNKEEIYYQTIKEWEQRTQFTMEYTDIDELYQRDVNNYIAKLSSGKVKTKGAYSPGIFDKKTNMWKQPLTKGYKYPVVPLSVYNYVVDGIPIEQTIRNHTDIYDFMLTQRVNTETFDVVFKSIHGGEFIETEGQKTNRYLVCNWGGDGVLVKRRKDDGKETKLVSGHLVTLANDVESTDVKNYPINYDYYIDEAYKLVDPIEPPRPKPFF